MANFYCEKCDKHIDLDFDVEHYEQCPSEELEKPKSCYKCGGVQGLTLKHGSNKHYRAYICSSCYDLYKQMLKKSRDGIYGKHLTEEQEEWAKKARETVIKISNKYKENNYVR